MRYFLLLLVIEILPSFTGAQSGILKTTKGKLNFVSQAPLETIKAGSAHLIGAINITTGNYSFKVAMKSFEGFNNPLQKEHFYENYMEIDEFPDAAFVGKIIEPIVEGKLQKVRAKGMLSIHGKTNEAIIELDLSYDGIEMIFSGKFDVLLDDYDIHVPRIVSKKISTIINVSVRGVLQR
ncbi:MAG: YceI family protein [Saprospiraceae bacterium]|nr:YceI family protein [Saprospiraceae bacterium]